MTIHHHDLATEMPEFKEAIHKLKESDNHFARLFDEYQELDKEIVRIEQEIDAASDERVEELKKKRLDHKDQLVAMLRDYQATQNAA